jgi:hypothetical protein
MDADGVAEFLRSQPEQAPAAPEPASESPRADAP